MMKQHIAKMIADGDPILEVQVRRAGRCADHRYLAEPVPCERCAAIIVSEEPVQVFTAQRVKKPWWRRLFR